jgi:16S rRNA (cytosine1402-N4)-methyltransferase
MNHKSVLLQESINYLNVSNGRTFLDLTLGSGGHSLKIIEGLSEGTFVGFDVDPESVRAFRSRLIELGFLEHKNITENIFHLAKGNLKIYLVNSNFSQVLEVFEILKISKVDGVIADLGWSTDQKGVIQGLSYENTDEELDMRLDPNLGVKASDLLNALNSRELEKMFADYADIYGRQNKTLAAEIISARKLQLFEKVGQLTGLLDKVFSTDKNNKYQIYSKVFQSLRIAVNQEYQTLKALLEDIVNLLGLNSILLIITFHSGEEKLVRMVFNELVNKKDFEYVTHQLGENFVRPSVEELQNNIKSRSAKLYGIKKI